ncbi:hypothetical protein LTR50_001161 [Elasticomyces elasticus]|nr:hypothetical protein LTR50_001161 [Elasticomyces elasticus]
MLYVHATIITVNSSRDIISDGAIFVQDSRIAAIGKSEALLKEHSHENVVDLEGRIIIPGLVNTHMHTAQTMLRGAADDLELVSWLCERIWPLQGNFTTEDGYAAARLSIAEMLKSGTTCFLESMFADRYGFDGLCKAVEESGIRGCLGKIVTREFAVMDKGTYAADPAWAMHPGLVEDRKTSLLGAVAMHEKWNGKANGRIREHRRAIIFIHIAASPMNCTGKCPPSRERKAYRSRCTAPKFASQNNHTPMSYCSSTNLLGPATVLVHMVHLDSGDITTLAETGTHVVHCPSSNTKLASGIAKVPEMLAAGVNVSLGTDGAPCNNTCDMLQEIRLAGILHKVATGDPTAVPAETVLEMATIGGAKALGLDDCIGSLEAGKKADFAVVVMRKVELQPWFSPVSAVVYTATGRDVEMVVVDGVPVVEHGKLLTMDEEQVWKEAAARARQVVERAGLGGKVRARWPVK